MNCSTMVKTLLLSILLCFCLACGGKYPLSDGSAAELIENMWKSAPLGPSVWLDHIVVISPMVARTKTSFTVDSKVAEVAPQALDVYKQLQSKSIITIENYIDHSKSFEGFGSFLSLSQNGYLIEFDARPAHVDPKVICTPLSSSPRRGLCVPSGTGKVTRIVKNELVEKPPNVYRLVLGEDNWDWLPLFMDISNAWQDANKIRRRTYVRANKFESLLKYDDFSREWKLETITYANKDEALDEAQIKSILQ